MSAGAELVERAVRGDAEAIERLSASHRPRAYRTALGVLGDPHAAEDVAQEAMVRLQSSLAGFRGDAEVTTWIHRVALNLSLDHIRTRRRRAVEVPLDHAAAAPDGDVTDPHRAVDTSRARAALRAAIERLPEEQREVLALRYSSGLSYGEIARVTGSAEGTVASRIYRALKRLGSDLEPKHLEILR